MDAINRTKRKIYLFVPKITSTSSTFPCSALIKKLADPPPPPRLTCTRTVSQYSHANIMLAVNEGKMLTHNDENKTNRALSHKKSKI